MNVRRLFWQAAAILLSLAALIAITGILAGSFGDTQVRILFTVGVAFVTASTALAGLACLDRGVMREAGWAATGVGGAAFLCWTFGIWDEPNGDGFWKVAGVLGIWLIALLSVTTLRLLTRAGGLAYTFFRVTVGCTLAAAVLSTVMVFAESGDAWQLLAVVSILAILGYLLTPITQRLAPTEA